MLTQTVLGLFLASGAIAADAKVAKPIVARQDCSADDYTCCVYYDTCDGSGGDSGAFYSDLGYYSDVYYSDLASELGALTSLYNDPAFTSELGALTSLYNEPYFTSELGALTSLYNEPYFTETGPGATGGLFTGFSGFSAAASATANAGSGGGSGGSPITPAASTPTSGGSSGGSSGGPSAPGGGNPLGGTAADLRVPTMASLLLGGLLVAVALL